MRILHVLDHSLPLQSGYSYRTISIMHGQRKLGWDVLGLTSPKHVRHGPVREEVEGFPFYRTVMPGGWRRIPLAGELALMKAVASRLDEVVEQVRPDLIHAHSPALNGLPAVWAARRRRIPVIYEVRALWEDAAVDHGRATAWGPRYRATRALETIVLRSVDAVTTICEGLKRELSTRGVPENRISVVPNAVDMEAFPASLPRDEVLAERLGLQNAAVLGFAGSFYGYEGLDLLISALPDLLKVDPSIRILLVGGGPQEAALRRLAFDIGLESRVTFVGRVTQRDVPRYYSLMDLCVYPRRAMRLTDLVTPLKPLEPMAYGRMVLASDVGGHRELIRDEETGYLFRAGDRKALVGRIADVLARRDEWPRMATAGRAFVESERSWATSVAQYRPVYSRLLGHPV